MKRANFPGRKIERRANVFAAIALDLSLSSRERVAADNVANKLECEAIEAAARKSKSGRKGDLKRGAMMGGAS